MRPAEWACETLLIQRAQSAIFCMKLLEIIEAYVLEFLRSCGALI